MNGHDGLRAGSDRPRDRCGVDIQGLGIDIDEDGRCAYVEDDIDRRAESHRRRDYFVSRPNPEGEEGDVQTGCTGVQSDRMLGIGIFRELSLE